MRLHRSSPANPRGGRRREEGVALVAVVGTLVVLVPLALGALAVVVQAQKGIIYERSRTLTAHVAEAGLDGATAALRAASSGGVGVRGDLPCADRTPITGTLGAQVPGLRYAVTIRYYVDDPRSRPESWRADNALPCTPGQGLARTPFYALLQSAATGSQALGSFAALRERSVEAVYRFDVDNANIGGGLFRTRAQNNLSAVDLCWSTSGAVPAAGAAAVATTCDDGSPAQMLSYRADHTVFNVSGRLCLTSTGVRGTALTFETCTGRPDQVWIYDTNDHIRAVDPTGTATVASCIAMAQPYAIGTSLILSADCGSAQSMWSPESRTGPGGAGAAQYQLVNFSQFARCFDVTDVNWDNYFMQLHPCKQSPTTLDWPPQQLVDDPVAHQLRFGNPADLTNRCLTSPDPAGTSEYVTTTPCDSGPRQQWTENGDTGDYSTSYTIVDAEGRCLAAGPVPPDPGRTFSSVIVAPCDGSLAEKWNAPPELSPAGLEGFRETTGG
ncbi:MAG TPA: ricin-type beta-trefoil lectin domain protein [Kineosporiaceae bacterium]|nr:ricin-type beta-trefoil lectin domain protein [Kineosporiaceae bacterium]